MKRYTRLLSLSLALGLAFILSCQAAFADCEGALSEGNNEVAAEADSGSLLEDDAAGATEKNATSASAASDISAKESETTESAVAADPDSAPTHEAYVDIVNHWAHEDIAYVINKGYMTAVATSGAAIDLTSGDAINFTTGAAIDLTSGAAIDLTTGEEVGETSGTAIDLTSGDASDISSSAAIDLTSGAAVDTASTAALYFEPYAGMSRQMLVSALYSMAQTYEKDDLVLYGVEDELPFSDITGNEPYYDAVMWAYHEGIVNGIDGKFCPDVVIDRQSMSVMIFRMISVLGVELETDWSIGLEYTDLEDISDWAVDAIAYTNAIGLMSGNPDGSFAPRRELTRAEAAVIIKRLDERMPESEDAATEDDSALVATDAAITTAKMQEQRAAAASGVAAKSSAVTVTTSALSATATAAAATDFAASQM